jgi:hypothetical protein
MAVSKGDECVGRVIHGTPGRNNRLRDGGL